MEAAEALRELERCGSESRRRIYRRHGYPEPMFGVSYADLGKLKKKIKVDHALAEALWKTGNADARVLATMIADPAKMTPEAAKAWISDVDSYVIAEALACPLAQGPGGFAFARQWMGSKNEFERCAGYSMFGWLLKEGADVPNGACEEVLARIERDILTSPNWARRGMNYTLIGIGGYRPTLEAKAIAAARRIGKVPFDPGETSCVLPDAAGYIAKMVAHRKKRGAAKGAR